MSANTNAVATTEPTSLAHLSDAELLSQTRSLVGRSNRLLAELLAHLGEVEARGIHRARACSSLYIYCIYELRFSEDEAFRRVAAARLVRRFPSILDAIAAGELHLTGLLMLGPHLTTVNLLEVLSRAKHRTKREIAELVRVLDPLPAVPARIEPLGPAPARLVPPEPTWAQFVGAFNPVRALEEGERPRDWGLGEQDPTCNPHLHAEAEEANGESRAESVSVELHAPARVAAEPCNQLAAPQRYKVQFTATEEYVQLVDEAKALLSHAAPRATLEDVQLRAMRAFVEGLRKRKYGAPQGGARKKVDAPASRMAAQNEAPKREGDETPAGTPEGHPRSAANMPATPLVPRQRGRHIPVAVRRAVSARDGHRCTYADSSGTRCAETRRLEFHHLIPFAVSPSHEASNLTLRCTAHNALVAEQDFGREFILARRTAARHDRFCEHSGSGPGRS